jgi:tetratricopeptide (TPR) repeat protein
MLLQPYKPALLNNKPLALKHLNRNYEALECLNQVIMANPDDEVELLIKKGSVLHNLKKYNEAIDMFSISWHNFRSRRYRLRS